MLNKKKSDETLAELVRNARKEKGLSARKFRKRYFGFLRHNIY